MRKMRKNKRCACGLCKPHKRGWATRWTEEEAQALRNWDRMKRALLSAKQNDDSPSARWYSMVTGAFSDPTGAI